MAAEIILMIDEVERVRSAVSASLARAGAYVEPVASVGEAIDFLLVFAPDWILVSERQADELLAWMGPQEKLRDVPVVLCPDVDLPARRAAEQVSHAA